jgi:hypothetical protein
MRMMRPKLGRVVLKLRESEIVVREWSSADVVPSEFSHIAQVVSQ